jgi:eukaryotic-like serine/threonine-protein kinase
MWNPLITFFARSRPGRDHVQGHMTFGQTAVGRTLSRTALLFKKQLWIWPIAAVALLALIGYLVGNSIHDTMEGSLRSQMQTLLSVERTMLEKWLAVQESSVKSLADQRNVRRLVAGLTGAPEQAPARTDGQGPAADKPLTTAEQIARLSAELEPGMSAHHFVGYVLIDKRMQVIASDEPALIGIAAAQFESVLSKALEGRTTVSVPYPSTILLKDGRGRLRSGTPTMVALAPVRDDNLQVIAVLAMRIRPEREFTDILQLGRIGESGETYAINRDGLLVSNSRFDEQLILLGILPDSDDAASILTVDARDPGGDMTAGFRPAVRRRELELTEAAAAATAGGTGVNTDGYRGYRGVLKAGAYCWLPDYDLGIITEIDHAEAFRPLVILKRTFYVLFALLAVAAAAIFVCTVLVSRAQRKARAAAIEARQLGQYRLLEKIGAGAMGVVYKGQHAMLRRPTAIKMLNIERVNEASTRRFEQEVQITCKLNNPHTVAIYDYGRTPEGVFYYAMEYLDGVNLQTLVEQYGAQPEGRVASILRQICASLYEAHSSGLVHRDIKPANIMLNRRGAEPDVVKVLDFGLVKAMEDGDEKGAPGNEMSGTPLYMSPESIQTPESVDACSDLYAVGAVGYFLITGAPPFSARSLGELCQQHLTAIPASPSDRLGRPVSAALEHAILACLEKSRAKRPQTARDLAALLDRVTDRWTLDEAEAWWSRHERGRSSSSSPEAARTMENGSSAATSAADFELGAAGAAKRTRATSDPGLDRTTNFDADGDPSA